MKDLTDFAVIARSASTRLIENLTGKDTVLRVVPLENAPTLSAALGGLTGVGAFNENQNMTLEADGSISKSNIHSVQDRGNGYVRVVAHINNENILSVKNGNADLDPKSESSDLAALENSQGFALLKGIVESEVITGWEVLAVASLQAGCNIADGCYVAFTFSKTNNYQSVSFSPNAFATIEDLKNINGLDGLHIAFDHASGDIKLLDGEGNVLDQANLHMDADTIIADGEEGYKYVKTDIQQDIHAEKDFMPAGHTAQNSVGAEYYAPKTACFLVEVDDEVVDGASTTHPIKDARIAVSEAENAVSTAQDALDGLKEGVDDPEDIATAEATLAQANSNLAQAKSNLAALELAAVEGLSLEGLSLEAIRKGDSDAIKGLRVYTVDAVEGTRSPADYILYDQYDLVTGSTGQFLMESKGVEADEDKAIIEVYSPDAFVWTVGSDVGTEPQNDDPDERTFAQQMNAAAASMGFHIGDDIPLGTNIQDLLDTMEEGNVDSPATGFDAEKFMHKGTDIDDLVDAQRALAKAELVEWNKQHPALERDDAHGTRISENGLDVRNGSIQIGNAQSLGESVKRAVIETDFAGAVGGEGSVDTRDRGLQIGLIETQDNSQDVKKDILTINAEDYISGAPTCLALLKCEKTKAEGEGGDGEESSDIVEATAERITANFTASGSEAGGVFTLTIVDNRANNGFGDVPRIVEIIPVYKSGADAQEAVPAQRSISAIKMAEPDQNNNNKSTLSIHCSQVLDWAQSIALGGGVDPASGKPVDNGMELYLIVKVY